VQVVFKCVCVKPHYSIPSLDRPLGLQEVEAPRTSRNAYEGGKTVSCMHQPPLPSGRYTWYSFLLEAEMTPQPLCSQKD